MKIKGAFQLGLAGGLGVLLAIAIGAAIGQISQVLLYAFAAIFLALGIEPIVQFLVRRKLPRWAAVLITFVVLIGAFACIVAIIVPIIVEQFTILVTSIINEFQSGQLEQVRNWVESNFNIDIDQTITWITDSLSDPETYASLPPWVGSIVTGLVGTIGQAVLTVGEAFIVLVLTLYFTGSLPALKSGLYKLVPASSRRKFIEIAEEIMKSVGRFVTGQAALGLCNGVLSFIMLSIVGSNLAAVYAFMAFLASLIPLVGTISASVLISLLVLMLDGPQTALPVAIYYLVYMQVEAYVISPQIMNRAVKVPGVVVVLAALVGGTLLGILGALVAIPVAAAIQLIFREVIVPRQALR